MNTASIILSLARRSRLSLLASIVLGSALLAPASYGQQEPETPPPAAPEPAPQVEAPSPPSASEPEPPEAPEPEHLARHGVILRLSEDSILNADETAESVIAIGGSVRSAGLVRDMVVAIFGDADVSGDVRQDVVVLFGDLHANSTIGGDVVTLFGDVELGPQARVNGELVVLSGHLKRDPAAVVHRGIQQVSLPADFGQFEWLRPWVKHCLLLARPLAFEPGLGWAWTLAFGFLTLYVVLALMFSSSIDKCVQTIETRPGRTVVASLLTLLLMPILTVLLAVTVVGAVLVPFVWIGAFVAGLFGKAVILAAFGRRLTRYMGSGPLADSAFAVLVGGIIMLGIYVVPLIGFIAYKVLGILGLGVIVYTLLLTAQARRESALAARAAAAPAAAAAASAPPPAFESTPDATPSPAASMAADITLPRAGFWIRMLALLIDVIVIGIAFNLLNSDDLFLLALAAYGAVMWKLKGTTVGGILCNLKVVRVDGREIDWGTAAVRALSCFLSLAALGLGFLWIVFDPSRQAWHDKIAGTAVVRVPQGSPLV